MGLVRDTFSTLKPVIYVAWIVAAVRLVLDATSTDPNVIAMASVYGAVAVLLLFCAFNGQLDRLAWKGLFVGALLLGVLCWFIPNTISYTIAQFQGWDHTRYHVDPEHYAIQKRYMDDGMGYFDAEDKATEELGRKGHTRGPPVDPTTAGKIKTGLTVGVFTTIGGTVWSLLLCLVLIGVPAAMRRRCGG